MCVIGVMRVVSVVCGLLIVCRVCVRPLVVSFVISARLTPDGFLRVIGRVLRVLLSCLCAAMQYNPKAEGGGRDPTDKKERSSRRAKEKKNGERTGKGKRNHIS